MREIGRDRSGLGPTVCVAGTFTLPPADVVARDFRDQGLVRMPNAVTRRGFRLLTGVLRELREVRFRRDFLMAQSGYSPRRMTVVGGEATNRVPSLMALYRDHLLLEWCSSVAGFPVDVCPNPIENVIFSILERPGNTHGWHVDDYPIAFIVVLETPTDPACGGRLEVGSPEQPEDVPLAAGDVYMMRSDLMHHRVSPLVVRRQRVIANFTYAQRGVRVQENGSADLLCAE